MNGTEMVMGFEPTKGLGIVIEFENETSAVLYVTNGNKQKRVGTLDSVGTASLFITALEGLVSQDERHVFPIRKEVSFIPNEKD
jgi:hypothetical protein